MNDVLRPVQVTVEFNLAMYADGPARPGQVVDIPTELYGTLGKAIRDWATQMNATYGVLKISGKEIGQ